jgi:Helix-turn-helix
LAERSTFSYFGRIRHNDFDRKAKPLGPFELPKPIHTERHRKMRDLLRERRKAAGLTQTVVAERLGKPPSYVAKYEGGDRRLDILEFLDVAGAIGFDPCAFIRALVRR